MILNLFKNPSFENKWYHPKKDNEITGWEFYEPISEGGIPELQLPNDWRFSNATAAVQNPHDSADHSKFVRPEVNHKHISQLPPAEQELFVLEGEYCLKIFKGYGTWWGILYQTFELDPGEYNMTVNVYADLVDHYENGNKVPAPDPNSGILRAVWGSETSAWVSLKALSQNEVKSSYTVPVKKTITVGFEVMCPFPINNNGMFFDAIKLEKVGEVNGDCENPAREAYDRTVVLLPPYIDPERAAEAMRYAWAAGHWSTVGSADDAGIGCGLNSRRVIAIDPKGWNGDLEAFFETYYPGLVYVPAAEDISSINLIHDTPYTLDQVKGRVLAADLLDKGVKLGYPTTHHPPYVTNTFGHPGPGYNSHNGLDLRSSYGAFQDEVLAAVNGKVVRAGYYSAEDWYGYQVRTQTKLTDGRIMLVRYGHFQQGGIYVSVGQEVNKGDKLGRPDNTGNSTGDHLHIDVKIEGGDAPMFYADPGMLIDWDEEEDPPVTGDSIYPEGSKGFIGIQALGGVANLLDYFALQPPVFKTVLMKAELGIYKRYVPKGHAVYRHWRGDEAGFRTRPDKNQAAQEWIDYFIQDIVDMMHEYQFKEIWIESINETYNNDRLHNQESIAFDQAFIQRLAVTNEQRYPDLVFRPIVMTAAVGNPALPQEDQLQWEELLVLARYCRLHKGAFGYHAYWFADANHPEYTAQLAPYLQDRYQAYDRWLRTKGVAISWIMTEGGPVGGSYDPATGGLNLFAANGWKKAYNGNWSMTLDAYLKRNSDLYYYSKVNGNRFLDTLFQSGSHDPTWSSFDVSGANLVSLGNKLKEANLP